MRTFTITLNEEKLNVVGRALALLPYGEVVSTVQEINKQISEQPLDKEEGISDA